jgi:hypothetical protein
MKWVDGGQELVSGFCPAENFWLPVVGGYELLDCDFQFLNTSMRATFDLPLDKECKPAQGWLSPQA